LTHSENDWFFTNGIDIFQTSDNGITWIDITSFFPDGIRFNMIKHFETRDFILTDNGLYTIVDENPIAICKDITVQLDANGSVTISPSDIDGGSSDAEGSITLSLDIDTFTCDDIGSNSVTLTVTDSNEGTDTCIAAVTVEDNLSPVMTVLTTPITLWPPNHKYETIELNQLIVSVSDNCTVLSEDDVYVSSVTSDEVENAQGKGDGNTMDDIVIASDCQSVQLRKERSGNGNGRVYTIYMEVNDENGNTSTASSQVNVPHNKGGIAIDDGMAYQVICGNTNKSTITNINKEDILLLNYPNPFKGTTTIQFSLKESNYTKLKVYNYLGLEVATLFNGVVKANKEYQIEYNGFNLPAGVYFYQLQSGADIIITKKMILIE